ncbi:uncharacterized protein BCR38DRAFT_218300 [Pseudomassariella vexata]|uniref:Uncharacterized protein n=1 Tax=Pseudomassariella vexata TaxID=1141098 RepID=A0A1Y2DV00_9PEZI|nr:uncharacterized protein BCR38DRAFT_218300 [Pseudomassariella vexata]ORY62956.1 hypothetical protein BCR38DRAFT_218300 [Pseudomassariella vexata]
MQKNPFKSKYVPRETKSGTETSLVVLAGIRDPSCIYTCILSFVVMQYANVITPNRLLPTS